MNALIVYDATYGNTEQIARAIADALATQNHARVISAAALPVRGVGAAGDWCGNWPGRRLSIEPMSVLPEGNS